MTSRLADGRRLAGFWRRALGALLDGLLVVVLASFAVPAYLAAIGSRAVDLADPNLPLVAGGVVLVAAIYDVLATRVWGGTLGKRVAGVRVIARDGDRPGTGQLLARLLGRIVSALPALLGFLWAGWDRRKQTWHDRLADTVVVRDEEPAPLPVADDVADDVELSGGPAPAAEQEPQAAPEPVDWRASRASEWAPPRDPPVTERAPSEGSEWAPPRDGPAAEQPPSRSMTQPAPPAPWTPAAPVQAPAWSSPPPAPPWDLTPPAPQGGLMPPPQPRHDANLVAVSRAGLGHDAAIWLQQVAGQVDARLDRLSSTWRGSLHAEAARACTFGLLIGHLARLYPHMRPELHATAELHPSFTTLLEGSRLATLEQIAAEPGRMAAWLGPLVDVQDPGRFRALLD